MGKDITEIKNELAEKNVLSMSTEELSTYIKDNISEKSNQEIIALLTDMWKDGIPYSFDFIDEIVKTRSMEDPCANSDAITIFYSGESEDVINTMAATTAARKSSTVAGRWTKKTRLPLFTTWVQVDFPTPSRNW